jgi:TolA-binding protein
MLTLSASQVEVGQTTNATKTLQELIKRFPNTEQAKTARSRLASIKPPAKK